MVRTLVGIIVLLAAVFWFPLWVQLALFALFIIFGTNRSLALIPAIISDALYAPGSSLSLTHHWMTLVVLGLLALHYASMRMLRVRSVYGVEA